MHIAYNINVIYIVTNLTLCIDSSHVDIIEAALRKYPGRALINSISNESAKRDPLLKIAKKYGAMFILLPLSDKGLPENLEEKIDIINEINRVDAKKNENMIPVYKYDVIYEDGDEGGYESPVKYDKSNKVITPEGELITIKRIRNNGKPIMMDMWGCCIWELNISQ